MNVADRPGKLVPGLATEWGVDPADQKKWRFTLRRDVKFHDGSSFNADAVIWNLDKVVDEKTPQFDKRQSAQVKLRLPSVGSYRKVDDYTIEITTKEVDSIFPYQMLWFLVSSPAQYEKVGRDWENSPARRQGPSLDQVDLSPLSCGTASGACCRARLGRISGCARRSTSPSTARQSSCRLTG
jgi:peptide/nickel transport system substrate-binding protein